MKLATISALVALVLCAGVGTYYWHSGNDDLVPTEPYYQQRLQQYRTSPETGRVVMVGDSLTAHGHWEWLDCGIVNRGIDWDTTAGVLHRLPDIERVGAEISVVTLGTNDLDAPGGLAGAAARYADIINRLRSRSRVIVVSTPLRSAPQREINRRITQLNDLLRGQCTDGRCKFIDLNARLAPRGFSEDRFLLDGVHLTPEAYGIWYELMREPLGCPARPEAVTD